MLKYYCEHCMKLYDSKVVCRVCGTVVSTPIVIDVQNQKGKAHIR